MTCLPKSVGESTVIQGYQCLLSYGWMWDVHQVACAQTTFDDLCLLQLHPLEFIAFTCVQFCMQFQFLADATMRQVNYLAWSHAVAVAIWCTWMYQYFAICKCTLSDGRVQLETPAKVWFPTSAKKPSLENVKQRSWWLHGILEDWRMQIYLDVHTVNSHCNNLEGATQFGLLHPESSIHDTLTCLVSPIRSQLGNATGCQFSVFQVNWHWDWLVFDLVITMEYVWAFALSGLVTMRIDCNCIWFHAISLYVYHVHTLHLLQQICWM